MIYQSFEFMSFNLVMPCLDDMSVMHGLIYNMTLFLDILNT